MNKGLLLAAAWRLAENPKDNIYKILKAKYFPDSSIWREPPNTPKSAFWDFILKSFLCSNLTPSIKLPKATYPFGVLLGLVFWKEYMIILLFRIVTLCIQLRSPTFGTLATSLGMCSSFLTFFGSLLLLLLFLLLLLLIAAGTSFVGTLHHQVNATPKAHTNFACRKYMRCRETNLVKLLQLSRTFYNKFGGKSVGKRSMPFQKNS